jgi:hypothetical protein
MYAFDDGDGVVGVLMKERGEAIVANPARVVDLEIEIGKCQRRVALL